MVRLQGIEVSLLLIVLLCGWSKPTEALPAPVAVCDGEGDTKCSVYNYMGALPNCKAGKVVYPTTEQEIVEAVAEAVRKGQKMRVVSKGSHSLPNLVCPGGNGTGLLISTRDYNRNVVVNVAARTATVDAGVRLKDFLDKIGSYGLTFLHFPYWAGLSISGVLGTGAHGAGIWGKGGAVHEYVTELRLVVPASPEEGYAKVVNLVAGVDDEILNAARVSLGVLGVISTVTLELQPMFKRAVSKVQKPDFDLEDRLQQHGQDNEFGDVIWFPPLKVAVFRFDNRVPITTVGEGVNNYSLFQPLSTPARIQLREWEENIEATGEASQKCKQAAQQMVEQQQVGNGFKNNELLFTGFPVVGFQNQISCSDSCDDTTLPGFGCSWDRRSKGTYFFQSTFGVPVSKISDFVKDVKALVELKPDGLCVLGLYAGVLMRYMKKSSTAYLGEVHDSVEMDFTYYRSYNPRTPRQYEDLMEEIEQMLVFKYKAKPHWGKNRNVAFAATKSLFAGTLPRFLKVKNQLDPQALFSNEWTDTMLDVDGAAANLQKFEPFCALEGNCICTEDIHCAPESGYFCRPGYIYNEARVCRKVLSWGAGIADRTTI